MKSWYQESDLQIKTLTGAEARPLIDLLHAVALDKGWEVEDHLEAYLDHSVFFAAERRGELLGGIKLVIGNSEGLPVNEGWPETNLVGRTDVADLSVLGMKRGERGNLFAMGTLCVAMWRYCLDHGVAEVWAELPVRNVKIYQRFGFPFVVMGEPRIYWGGPGVPARMLVDETSAMFRKRTAQAGLYQNLFGPTL